MFYYLGIDIGGGANTWALALERHPSEKKLSLVSGELSLKDKPSPVSLQEICEFLFKRRVLVTALDAPLSFSLALEKGLRRSDQALRELLPSKAKSWVLSYHGLMGIPLRAYLLAKSISPYCGTILETHPRASLYFLLPNAKREIAFKYKKEGLSEAEILWLRDFLRELFSLDAPLDLLKRDGVLDALICALTAYLYQKAPEKLFFLPQEEDLEGFGPFVVIWP